MASNNDDRHHSHLRASAGMRDLRQAKGTLELKVEDAPRRQTSPKSGFDPYNTSGSFDRKKNWARVGKR